VGVVVFDKGLHLLFGVTTGAGDVSHVRLHRDLDIRSADVRVLERGKVVVAFTVERHVHYFMCMDTENAEKATVYKLSCENLSKDKLTSVAIRITDHSFAGVTVANEEGTCIFLPAYEFEPLKVFEAVQDTVSNVRESVDKFRTELRNLDPIQPDAEGGDAGPCTALALRPAVRPTKPPSSVLLLDLLRR
jgi:hypothetical protein